jgi:hypothetical protein
MLLLQYECLIDSERKTGDHRHEEDNGAEGDGLDDLQMTLEMKPNLKVDTHFIFWAVSKSNQNPACGSPRPRVKAILNHGRVDALLI